MSSYIEFIKNNNGDNILMPIVDITNNSNINEITKQPDTNINTDNKINDYYSTVLPSKLPDDFFIRWYYACLSIIGLYVLFRIFMKGR